jgi:hypothetical protein
MTWTGYIYDARTGHMDHKEMHLIPTRVILVLLPRYKRGCGFHWILWLPAMMHVLCCASLLAGDVSDARHVGGEPDKMCAWRLETERKYLICLQMKVPSAVYRMRPFGGFTMYVIGEEASDDNRQCFAPFSCTIRDDLYHYRHYVEQGFQ